MIHYGDITKLNGADLPPVDVVTGGSPCQDLSVAAGKRAGLAGERSGLFMEQVRVIKEMREHDRASGRTDKFVRPRFMVWENVPGALSSGDPKGGDFRIVLEETARIAEPFAAIPRPEGGWQPAGCVMGDGWSVAWRVHDAQFWGVPQRRRRIALVADFGGQSAPEILFNRKGVSGDSAESGQARAGTAGATSGSPDPSGCSDVSGGVLMIELTSTKNTIVKDGICPTLTQRMGTGGNQVNAVFDIEPFIMATGQANAEIMKGWCATLNANHEQPIVAAVSPINGPALRRLTPLECERLQGFPDGWTDIGEWTDTRGKAHKASDTARYKALGNSIALPYWKVLARKIAAQYDRDITMGSLFDGIGGFPLAFQHCGATPAWASEIEEFCIAVTKRRFGE